MQFSGTSGIQLPLVRHGEPGALRLADGAVYKGFSFGANTPIAGEVVFNTGAADDTWPPCWPAPTAGGEEGGLTHAPTRTVCRM